MASASSHATSISPTTSADTVTRAELSAIDESTKAPALFFLCSALLWLLAGTAFAVIASIKLHNPSFLGDSEWLTFGRVRTAHLNAVTYGWGVNVSFAVALWLMARLSQSVVRHNGLLMLAGALWNVGITIGLCGILAGDSTSVEWLEMPAYATPMLFVAYALVAAWAVITFRHGKSEHTYVSQWYILAALFWFPWLYSVAQVMVIFAPARGTVQSLVNWWFTHNFIGLWFVPMGLAAIYYFLPKILGKAIHSYYLSMLGFWSLAIFTSWAGVRHLMGGPVPAWVITTSVAASFMMVVPTFVIAINHFGTLMGSFGALKRSTTLRFIVFGAVSYTSASVLSAVMASRGVNETLQFTHATVGQSHHELYAFFTMVMFGSIYYILPRILNREWPSAVLINIHFWSSAVGVIAMVLALWVVGSDQGQAMNNASISFLDVVRGTLAGLRIRSFTGVLMTIGHIAFAINLIRMISKPRRANTSAVLFRHPEPDLEVTAR